MDIKDEWISRLHKAQVGHYISSEKLYFWAKWNGFALVFCTVCVTLLTFYNINDLAIDCLNENYKSLLAILGGASALLSSYQTMYRPSERAEIHRSQASDYGALRRKLELVKHSEDDEKINKVLHEIENKWEVVASNSPLTKSKIITLMEKEGRFFSVFNETLTASDKK